MLISQISARALIIVRLLKEGAASLERRIRRLRVATFILAALAAAVVALCVWPALGLIAIGWWLFWRRRTWWSDTHGSARWAGYWDLWNAGCLNRQGCFALGKAWMGTPPTLVQAVHAILTYSPARTSDALELLDARGRKSQTIFLPDPGPPHVAVYGASGSGKSTAFAAPNLIQDQTNAVVLDPKGEMYRLTGKHRERKFGHQVVAFDPFNVACRQTDRFNPLSLAATDPKLLLDNAKRLANALVVKTPGEKEPFWNSAASVVAQTVIAFLMAEAKQGEANLNRLRDLSTSRQLMAELLDHLDQSDACGGMLKRLAGNVRWYQGQTEASIYSVLNTHLDFLDSIPISEALGSTSFDPCGLTDGKMTVYLILPIDRLQEIRGLQRIVITSFINSIFAAGESRSRRIRFFLDEAVSLGEMDSVYNALVYGRSFGMRLAFFYQSTGQVSHCFPDNKAHDFRATTASVFCGVNDYATAKEVSDWVGQTTVQTTSKQTSTSWGSSENRGGHDWSQGSNHGRSESTTVGEAGRALIQPEEVLQLPKSAAVALLPNTPPILFFKAPYYLKEAKPKRLLGEMCDCLFVCGLAYLLWIFTLGASTPEAELQRQRIDSGFSAAEEFLSGESQSRSVYESHPRYRSRRSRR